jgi:transposase
MAPLQAYRHPKANKDGTYQQYVRMSMYEYMDKIKEAIPLITMNDPLRGGLRGAGQLVLLQDEASTHISEKVKTCCEHLEPRPLHLLTLPPKSPDLTPCDSSFFAAVKDKWNRQTRGAQMAWKDKCVLALKLIAEQNPDSFINEMPLRWQASEDEGGWHIESRLKELKGH